MRQGIMKEHKICTKCHISMPLRMFHKTSRKYETSEGLEVVYQYHHAKCKKCRVSEKRKYDKEHNEQIKAYNEHYRQTKSGKIRSYYIERKHRSDKQIPSEGGLVR